MNIVNIFMKGVKDIEYIYIDRNGSYGVGIDRCQRSERTWDMNVRWKMGRSYSKEMKRPLQGPICG